VCFFLCFFFWRGSSLQEFFVANSTSSQVGDLAHGDPAYALGEIRVTTTSTVAEI
jgi:hypothetical protein